PRPNVMRAGGKSKKLERSPPSPEAMAGEAETPVERSERRGRGARLCASINYISNGLRAIFH
ncbi:MAG: hypothetical protein JW965_09715, partial [Bacteroidales bacterium]|nr:hypothetical protein [Bacteroidales bacterium]